jgi:hypothetical protein
MARKFMLNRFFRTVGALAVAIALIVPARAETPSPDAVAAARDLIVTMRLTDQFKAILPTIMDALKPAIVQGRAEVERDYAALGPALTAGFQARMDELTDAMAMVYANNFTVDEIHTMVEFYRTPTGQSLLRKTPGLTQQSLAAGQQFGRSVAEDLRTRIVDELRKKGHSI